MGQSTNAVLAYGYDLAGGDDEWKIAEVGEFGEPNLPWFNPDGELEEDTDTEDDDEAETDFVTLAEKRLLAEIAGFSEEPYAADGYYDRKQAAEKLVGVEFESYCSGEYSMWVLATHVITVYRGDSKLIDPAELAAMPEREGWDAKLAAAVAALGITPTQTKPGWVLVSYWG